MRPNWFVALWLCAAGYCVDSACAQSEPAVRGVQRVNLSTGGIGLYRPEKWGAIKISLRNPQDREVNLLATTHFEGDPTLQYGRRFWMPPQSRMVMWHPIRMPALDTAMSADGNPEQKFFELQTQVMSTEGGVETLAISEQGALNFVQSFRISDESQTTAVIGKPGIQESVNSKVANPYDLMLTARYERGLTRNLVILGDEQAPAGEEVLGALDQLVVFDDRLAGDLAGITAIRRWVVGGGRLWIMADQIRPELLSALLGEEASLNVVDTAELTHIRVIPGPTTGSSYFERDCDHPVSMLRVVGDGFVPAFLCDGWPAALWKPYGSGRILITTLGADGWVRPREDNDPLPESGMHFYSKFFPGQPLVSMTSEFFDQRVAADLPRSSSEQAVQGLIGYRIPGRGFVVGSLLLFSGMIVGAGLWMSQSGMRERLGLAIPVFSVLIAGMLLGAGMKTRSEIPNRLAAVQLVQAVPGTEDVRLTGSLGVFTGNAVDSAQFESQSGGWGIPDMTGLEGTTRRMIWSDLDHWNWEKLSLKPGLRTVEFLSEIQVDQPLRATASFEGGELGGHIQLPEEYRPSDAILATTHGRIGLRVDEQGRWSIDQESLGAGQYLSATVLSDEQQLRSELLSKILAPNAGQFPPSIPTIYAWTKPWNTTISAKDQSPIGSSVVAIPLTWQPMAPGTEFTLPRALLTFREIMGPDGIRPSGLFDARSRQFVEKSGSRGSWVAFDVPMDLLPLDVRKVEVTMKVVGPMGRLELSAYKEGKLHSLQVWENPVGTVQYTVDDGSLMPFDAQGRMFFRIDAGVDAPETPIETNGITDPTIYWQFDDITVRITAEVPDTTAAVSPK